MALIAPGFIDCVVAIGTVNNNQKRWIGTGFLFGNLIEKTEDGRNRYNVYLVTNRHVLSNIDNIVVRFNSHKDDTAGDYAASLKDSEGRPIWTHHPDDKIDVAVLSINIELIRSQGMRCGFFESDKHTTSISKMKSNGMTEGDFIYVMGFPMGIVAEDRQHVFVRSGIISRIQDVYESKSKDFVIDSFVFPGNSGGPVLMKPEHTHIQGTKCTLSSCLIGIVKGYIPYVDNAVSLQTGRQRVTFEENTGLTKIETVDSIIETILYAESVGQKLSAA